MHTRVQTVVHTIDSLGLDYIQPKALGSRCSAAGTGPLQLQAPYNTPQQQVPYTGTQ